MKKLFRNLMLMAIAAITFAACEDVPAPYDVPGTGNNQPGAVTELEGATGSGTLEDPYNTIAAINLGKKLENNETTDFVYIKGKISSIKEEYTSNYGNGTFYISEDGTAANQFYVYRALYLGNKKFTGSEKQIKEQDEVIICGKITNYNGTIETAQNNGFLYSLNGETAGGEVVSGEAKGSGTQADPFNVQAIIDYVSALAADVDTKQDYYVKGIVTSIPNDGISTSYNNLTFYISDDKSASNRFYVFRAKGLNGEDVTENMIKVGDEVVIFGSTWVNYKGNTPETKQGEAYIVSITPGEGGGETPGGEGGGGEVSDHGISIDFSTMGYSNAEDIGVVTLADGTTLTFDAGDNRNGPKYYNVGTSIRMYPQNSFTVNASKTISSIVLTCSENNAEGNVTASIGSVNTEGMTVSINNVNGSTTTVTNVHTGTGATSQLRIKSLTINYAE